MRTDWAAFAGFARSSWPRLVMLLPPRPSQPTESYENVQIPGVRFLGPVSSSDTGRRTVAVNRKDRTVRMGAPRRKTPAAAKSSIRRAPRTLIAKFYRAADGSQPVDDFIEGMVADVQVIIDAQIARVNMLDEVHNQLVFPHSSQVRGSLRELRCHYGNALYRILYRQSGHFVILLHMIRKNSGPIPEPDIRIAEQRWSDFQVRIGTIPVVPPRAAGKDAPRKRKRTT